MEKSEKDAIYKALSLMEVANETDLLVTVRMPRSVWEAIHTIAGQPKPIAPQTGLRRKLDSVFPPLALFGSKKK